MSKDNKKSDKKFDYKEELIDQIPEEFDQSPSQEAPLDPLEDSFADLFEATGVRDIIQQILPENQKQGYDMFLDGLLKFYGKAFNDARSHIKNPKTRKELISAIAKNQGYKDVE